MKHTIVIASVLKPVNDTRMFEKFGLSLSQTNKYDINIIGFWAKKIPLASNIRFHPIFNFKRLNILRLLAPWKCLRKFIQLKPQLIIINTHELLIVSILYKILFGSNLVYDVRENYFRNILFNNNFPLLLRPFLAAYVRSKEYLSRPFLDHFFLAERHYENEFSYSRGKSTIVENKFKPLPSLKFPLQCKRDVRRLRLLFTGTLAQSTGVFDAIEIAKQLHRINDAVRLDIIGYCSMADTYYHILKLIEDSPFIRLTGGLQLVPHEEIVAAILQANFGIVFYPSNKSTMNSIPTKLYEYLGCKLPIIIQDHQPWVDLCERYQAAVTISRSNFQPEQTLFELLNKTFYTNPPKNEVLWVSEEVKVLNIIKNLLQ